MTRRICTFGDLPTKVIIDLLQQFYYDSDAPPQTHKSDLRFLTRDQLMTELSSQTTLGPKSDLPSLVTEEILQYLLNNKRAESHHASVSLRCLEVAAFAAIF